MTTRPIDESGMRFGPFPAGRCFAIEKSAVYRTIRDGVQMAEFLLLRNDGEKRPVLWMVEAKSSSPRPGSQMDFDAFIAKIRDKLTNAFALGWAVSLRRHPETYAELPAPFKELDLTLVDVRFVLVINGHKESWLGPINDALKKALRPTVRTWAFSPNSVVAVNEEGARKLGLIL